MQRFVQATRFAAILTCGVLLALLFRERAEAANPVSTCDTFEPLWSSAERGMWTAICSGKEADADYEPVDTGFVKTILTKEPYASVLRYSGIHLTNAQFRDPLSLRGLSVETPITISNSVFYSNVDMGYSHFTASVRFLMTDFLGGLILNRAKIDGSLLLGDAEEIDPDPKKGHGIIVISSVNAEGLRIGGDLSVAGVRFLGPVVLEGCNVGGYLSFSRDQAPSIATAVSDVGGQAIFVDDELSGDSSDAQATALNLYALHTPQAVYLNRSIINGSVNIMDANIRDLNLLGTRLNGLDATAATLSGFFNIGANSIVGASEKITKWGDASKLVLRRSDINTISSPESMGVWPRNIDFTDFRIHAFIVGNCPAHQKCDESTTWYEKWLSLQDQSYHSFQPYQVVSSMLAEEGDAGTAKSIAFAGRDAQLASYCTSLRLLRCVFLASYRTTIGYGYHPEWSIFVMGLFVVTGTIVFSRTPEARAKRQHIPIGVAYSFDMFLPLIRIREAHYKIDIKGRARYYLYIHRIVGWVVGSFLVASITGIT